MICFDGNNCSIKSKLNQEEDQKPCGVLWFNFKWSDSRSHNKMALIASCVDEMSAVLLWQSTNWDRIQMAAEVIKV